MPRTHRRGAIVAWCAAVASCGVDGRAEKVENVKVASRTPATHLRVDDTVGDLLEHPAFAGFGRLLLPWDDRRYDATMPLREIGSLLPYHTHVDPAVVVSSLNRMIDDEAAGRAVFHDFYTAAEKEADPSRRNTGLFFICGRPGAPFAVIAPGGGFAYVGSVHEGFPYAVEISERGLNAFVLKYRAGQGGHVATEDLAAALTYVFRNSDRLGVATAGYSLWGSSAGARMAASIGSHGAARFGGATLPGPSAVVLLYTGHSDVAATEPPTFVAVGETDGIAPPAVMERRVAALRRTGTDVAYHRYPGVGHGFGLGVGTSAEGWIADAVRFWAKHTSRPEHVEEALK
jgi:acetyl esterase/lipase